MTSGFLSAAFLAGTLTCGTFSIAFANEAEIQPLMSCALPTRVYLSSEQKPDSFLKFKSMILAKGHSIITDSDLAYVTKALNRGDIVYAADHNQQMAISGINLDKLKFPMLLKEFNQAVPKEKTEPTVVNEDALKATLQKLIQLVKKSESNTLTPQEKSITLLSLIDGVFQSEVDLAKLKVTIVLPFGPRKAIPYHPSEFALEEGYGDEDQNVVTAITISGTELKRRVLLQLDLGTQTIADLKANQFMPDAGLLTMNFVSALDGGNISDNDLREMTEQFISKLPDCTK